MGAINKLGKNADVRARITELVSEYIKVFPDEFNQVKQDIAAHKMTLNNSDASTEGDNVIYRELYRLPETLHQGLRSGLLDEQWEWLQTETGRRWFANMFPAFRVTKNV